MPADFTSLPFDISKSLEALENEVWGRPNVGATDLIKRCHALRKQPLNQFTPDDCRLLLGQNIGAEHLVPLALVWLRENPLIAGMHFGGDLLLAVLRLDESFWQRHPDLWWEVRDIATEVEILKATLEEEFMPQLEVFSQQQPERAR